MSATQVLQKRFAAALMPNYGLPPLALARGEGCRVWDADGREYLDLFAGIAVSALGHAHPALTAAVTWQVNAIAHSSNLFLLNGSSCSWALVPGRPTPGFSSPTPAPRPTRRRSNWSGATGNGRVRASSIRYSWPPRTGSTGAPWARSR
jgi:hypothetical protein